MNYIYVIIFLLVSLNCSNTFAADPASGSSLSPRANELLNKCNLESRNSLVSGDLALTDKVCMEAVKVIEKSDANKEFLINPIMNLAVSYSMAGQFDKAAPLYNRARDIRKELYGPDSIQVKEIDDTIRKQEEMKRQHRK
ncbi:MAG: tetratricopeptide repeat protein [Nitrospirae bacterium]|nr:tetratricopeptide repeat protein [Nitrospirota bacterium]